MESPEFRFERFAMDTRPHHRALLVDGKRVALDSQAFNVLEFLVRHRDRAWTVDEILQKAFRTTLAPGNVTVQISATRRVLRECGCRDDLICTLKQPTRYQFVGDILPASPPASPPASQPASLPPSPVSPDAPAAAPSPAEPVPAAAETVSAPPVSTFRLGRKPALIAVSVIALALPGLGFWRHFAAVETAPPLTIAVMPFQNESRDSSLDPLADAVTDDLNADLFHVPGALVIARRSAAQHEGESEQQIGRALHVRYVVEGSVNIVGGAYKVHAALTDAADGTLLGEWDPERPKDQLSELRLDVLAKIASPLHLKLNDVASTAYQAGNARTPDNWGLFIEARHILDWGDQLGDFLLAQSMLEKALTLDPGFTEAQAELGWMLLLKVALLDDADEGRDLARAREVIHLALQSPNAVTLARVAYAKQLQMDGKCPEATPILRQVLAAEESNLDARSVLARCAQFAPDLAEAATQYRIMLRLDPDSPDSKRRHLALGTILLVDENPGPALGELALCREDSKPSDRLTPAEQCRLLWIAAEDLDGQQPRARADYAAYAQDYFGRTVWRFSAYFPPVWQKLRGFQRFQGALRDAGMPPIAPENQEGLQPGAACGDGDFARTPSSLGSAGVVIDTPAFKKLVQAPGRIVIDVGRGTTLLPAWLSYAADPMGEDAVHFATRMADEHAGSNRQQPLVVLGDGVTGCAAYNAAIALHKAGYRQVYWYRGGEEAFANAK